MQGDVVDDAVTREKHFLQPSAAIFSVLVCARRHKQYTHKKTNNAPKKPITYRPQAVAQSSHKPPPQNLHDNSVEHEAHTTSPQSSH